MGRPWERGAKAAAGGLLVAAAVALVLQVSVTGPAGGRPSCGSGWDVVAGRTGWEQWWSADLDGAEGRARSPLTRTLGCPAAVNHRIVVSGALAAGALAVGSVGPLLVRPRRRAPDTLTAPARRARRLGGTLTWLGAALSAGGLAGLTLLVADPGAPLFLYVNRAVVALAGLLLVLAAVLVMVLGRVVVMAAERLAGPDPPGPGRNGGP